MTFISCTSYFNPTLIMTANCPVPLQWVLVCSSCVISGGNKWTLYWLLSCGSGIRVQACYSTEGHQSLWISVGSCVHHRPCQKTKFKRRHCCNWRLGHTVSLRQLCLIILLLLLWKSVCLNRNRCHTDNLQHWGFPLFSNTRIHV